MSLVPDTIVSLAEDDTIGSGKNIVAGASVNITKSTGGSASIFSDAAGTSAISLPTVTDSSGELKFWIATGLYVYTVGGKSYNVNLTEKNDFVVETFADLATTPATTAGMIVYTKQHTSGGLGGKLFQDTAGTVTNNGVTLINNTVTAGRHWKAIGYDNLSPLDFGAIGDGVNDDTAAIQAWFDFGIGGKSPRKTYKTTNTAFITSDNVIYDFGGSTINNQAGSMYAVVMVTDDIVGNTEADLINVMNTLHYGNEIKNSIVKNLVITMSPTSGSGSNLGAGIVYGNNCVFENIVVTQTNGNGFEIRNSTNCGLKRAVLTPRTYGMFNFMTRDCYAEHVYVSGSARGIITKQSQAGASVNFRAYRCIVENLTNTLYYTVGGEWKERDLTDPIYQFGQEIVSDVHYDHCIFRSSSAAVKVDLSFWATRFLYSNCVFYSATAAAGINAGLSGNQITAKSGTVDTSGVNVTYVSGDNFAGQTAGTPMVINGVTYTIQSRTSDTAIVLTASAGVQSGVAYSIAADVQGKNHVFDSCFFISGSTVGAVGCSIGADSVFDSCTFNGSYQRAVRASSGYNPTVSIKSSIFDVSYEGTAAVDLALISAQSSTVLRVSDCEIKATAKAGSGVLLSIIYNADIADGNEITVTGSSTYTAYPVTISVGTAKDNEIIANGFNAIDGITINDAALVHDNKLTHDGTSTGTARAIYGASGSVQVKDIFDNKFYGWDSNSTGVLGNNVQYPIYADEAAAVVGGLDSGRFYTSSDGIMRVKA